MSNQSAAEHLRNSSQSLIKYRIAAFVVLCAVTCIAPGFLSGILWGIFGALYAFLYICISDPRPIEASNETDYQKKLEEARDECIRAEEPSEQKIYKGWMNILAEKYTPTTFHVNNLQSVLVRLDGKILRISRPNRAILKHAYHTDPSLTESLPRMMAQSMYDLTNATVKLRPRRLSRRRWFSRKYPICIKLATLHNRVHVNPYEERVASIPEIRGIIQKDQPPSTYAEELHRVQKQQPDEDDTISGGAVSGISGGAVSYSAMSNASGGEFSSSPPDDEAPIANYASAGAVEEVAREATEDMSDADSEGSEAGDEGGALARSISDAMLAPHASTDSRVSRYTRRRGDARSIYLFARTAREKERWFHRLRRACYRFVLPEHAEDDERTGRRFSLPNDQFSTQAISREYFIYILQQIQFKKNIDEIMDPKDAAQTEKLITDPENVVLMDLGRSSWTEPIESSGRELVLVANLFATRLFYDFCRDNFWIEAVRNKIQTKIAQIHLPYFIDTLELSGFDLGTAIPSIEKIYAPFLNEWGVWTDFEINYDGMIKLALETRVDLMRIKEAHDSPDAASDAAGINAETKSRTTPSRYSDEDIPESPETSPDEDYGSKIKLSEDNKKKKTTTGQKFLHAIDKLASTHIFNKASELRPIRKMLEEVSSTRLMLNVEITQLKGMMTINLAPPPSDRLWWGFRKPPTMHVHAVPQIGERSVAFSTLSDWIEKKVVNLLRLQEQRKAKIVVYKQMAPLQFFPIWTTYVCRFAPATSF